MGKMKVLEMKMNTLDVCPVWLGIGILWVYRGCRCVACMRPGLGGDRQPLVHKKPSAAATRYIGLYDVSIGLRLYDSTIAMYWWSCVDGSTCYSMASAQRLHVLRPQGRNT